MSSEAGVAIALARGPLIGTFLGLFLYGATCMQAFFYFFTYYDDHRTLKLTVALLVALETIHAALSIWLMDNYLITGYGNLEVLKSATWLSTTIYVLGLLIDFLVYLYFIWRIWFFMRSAWIVVLMMLISVSRTAISITASVLSVLQPGWRTYLDHDLKFLIIGNVLFIVGDTISATAMAYQLTRFKNWAYTSRGKRHSRINILINRLLIFAVATGTLTVIVDIVALVLTLALPQSLAFLSAVLVQTRLYANSLLASVNIRKANSRAYDNASTTTNFHARGPGMDGAAVSLRFAHPSEWLSVEHDHDHEHLHEHEHEHEHEHDLTLSDEQSRPSIQPFCPRKSTAESWHTALNAESFQVTQV